MKYIRYLLILFCLSFGIVVNGHSFTVDEIFENFKTAYNKSKNFSAEFQETTLYKTRKNVTTGHFTFGKPNLLRKEFVSPKNPKQIVKVIVLDGSHAWSYVPLYKQVNKRKWDTSERREILPGIGASLEDVSENWDMELVPDEAANAKGVFQIRLTPKPHLLNRTNNKTSDENIEKETLEIWVQEKDWLPVQFGYVIEFPDKSRRSVITSLSKIKRDQELSSDVFKFNVPENAEVIDFSEK